MLAWIAAPSIWVAALIRSGVVCAGAGWALVVVGWPGPSKMTLANASAATATIDRACLTCFMAVPLAAHHHAGARRAQSDFDDSRVPKRHRARHRGVPRC